MTNFLHFVLLSVVCSLAVAYAAPRQIKALKSVGLNLPITLKGAVYQGVFLSVLGSALGIVLSSRTGFAFLAFSGLGNDQNTIWLPLFAITLAIVVTFLGHLIIYYFVFRPRLSENFVITSENLRIKMGLLARVLQGGVVEEVQFRWGLMSVLVWLGLWLFPRPGTAAFWIGIVLSSLLFALFHYLGAVQLGIGNSPSAKRLTIIDNLWGGIAFGWLFWQFGLLAAISSHAMIHVLWYPFERHYLTQDIEIPE
ncbi:MAG: CPBP family glutamic-type intramembrane protease [Anaerolineae bacterium]